MAPLGEPLFVLNLKSYPTSVGPAALELGRLLERSGRRFGVSVAIAPAPSDLARLAAELGIPVLAQHVDGMDPGARTGFTVPDAVARSGGRGSLVNHSEHPIALEEVRNVVLRLESLRLVPVVCARDVEAARQLAAVHPPYLAVEPPELIGGDRAVSTARPDVVSDSVHAVRSVSPSTRVLCGAGVHDRNDVAAAIRLGSVGVLVASAVTKAADPRAAIEELLAGFPAPG